MKLKHIFLLLISSIGFLLPSYVQAQAEQEQDTVPYQEKFGLRVGIDLSKPLRTLIEEDYRGFEVKGDYRIYDDYYLAAEIGNEKDRVFEENVTASARGSYIKLGADYNAYNNWQGMQNIIYAGLRYAFASFSTELEEYAIYTRNPYFERDVRIESQEFNNLTANWVELQFGLKVEVLNNLYLGAHIELKRRIGQAAPSTFDNLYIPGFNRTYDDSSVGTGYGYSISYLIPLYRM